MKANYPAISPIPLERIPVPHICILRTETYLGRLMGNGK
jgi:hypothetical protein